MNTDKVLADWAKAWKEENLTDEQRKLISQANWDLYNGPARDGSFGDPTEDDEEWDSFPGFSKAVDLIKDALDDAPRTLYIDDQSEEVMEREPQVDACEDCNGTGKVEGEDFITKCESCSGSGVGFQPEYYKIERAEILKALVGKELVQYVK
jgi:hypothetical protein